jgi:antitoxin VapB
VRQINIKNDTAAELLDDVLKVTGQGKTEAVITALELYLKSLEASKRAEAAIALVNQRLHPAIDPEYLGRAPSKAEQEELLGM